jgi:trans-aconitate methyltransferase
MAKVKYDKPGNGWFDNQDFRNRIAGLHLGDFQGKRVLDLGCAEGKSCELLIDLGAASAVGFDWNMTRVTASTKRQVHLEYHDLNDVKSLPRMDRFEIVLLLAVLKNMKQPEKLLQYALDHCSERIAIRTPVLEQRIGARPYDIERVCEQNGFKFESRTVVVNSVDFVKHQQNKSWIGVFARDGD